MADSVHLASTNQPGIPSLATNLISSQGKSQYIGRELIFASSYTSLGFQALQAISLRPIKSEISRGENCISFFLRSMWFASTCLAVRFPFERMIV